MKPVTCINVARETGHAVLSLDGAEYAVSLDDLQKILSDIAGPRPAPATELLRPSLLPKLAQCPFPRPLPLLRLLPRRGRSGPAGNPDGRRLPVPAHGRGRIQGV